MRKAEVKRDPVKCSKMKNFKICGNKEKFPSGKKDSSKEKSKEFSKEKSKEWSKEKSKECSKEKIKECSKEKSKEYKNMFMSQAQDVSKALQKLTNNREHRLGGDLSVAQTVSSSSLLLVYLLLEVQWITEHGFGKHELKLISSSKF
jgi:hypothetical protein